MKKMVWVLTVFCLLVVGCATTRDLKRLESKINQHEMESLEHDGQIIRAFKSLVDAYNLHLQILHSAPRPESINPDH